jgi:hypothetical protein
MNIQSNKPSLIIGTNDYPIASCWAHYSERQARCGDAKQYFLAFPLSLTHTDETQTEKYIAGITTSDHWLNFVLQQCRKPGDAIKWVLVSAEGIQRSGDMITVQGKCREFQQQ